MYKLTTKIHPLRIITAISIIIFSVIGLAAVTGQIGLESSESSEPAMRPKQTRVRPNITPIIVINRFTGRIAKVPEPCADCAVVDSIVADEIKASGTATDLDSAGLAASASETKSYVVKLRLEDGSYRVISQRDRPVFHVGEKIRIVNGEIVQLEDSQMTDQKRLFALILGTLASRKF